MMSGPALSVHAPRSCPTQSWVHSGTNTSFTCRAIVQPRRTAYSRREGIGAGAMWAVIWRQSNAKMMREPTTVRSNIRLARPQEDRTWLDWSQEHSNAALDGTD